MNLYDHHCYHMARLVLETVTPLSIASGSSDGVFDTLLVRDANDLPAIPGTSLAGVLRSLLDEKQAERLFGYADGNVGEASRVQVSWGCIHDSNNQPVEGLQLEAEGQKRLKDDTLLKLASESQPLVRDHVKIDHRGTASDQAKFDRTALPAGYRFSVEISLWSDATEDPDWNLLLSLFTSPALRLGGATRRGYGALSCISAHGRSFDLRNAEDFQLFSGNSRHIGNTESLPPIQIKPATDTSIETANVSLEAEDFWRFGQGNEPVTQSAKPADLLPDLEPRVIWENNRGKLLLGMVRIPASGIKGAIAHRTAYHYSCLTDAFDTEKLPEENPALRYLFGYTDKEEAHAGAIIINDEFIPVSDSQFSQMMHNAIDRFTGGVQQGALFSEELCFKAPINFSLLLLHNKLSRDFEHHDLALKSFELALQDLADGRLSLGAAANRGHGYFTGKVVWSNEGEMA